MLAVEKRALAKLQDARTVRKICSLDEHVALAFAGLTADARVLVNIARVECQSHRLTVEDPVTVEYITRYIATICQVCLLQCRVVTLCDIWSDTLLSSLIQRYTQSNGARPFGISLLIVGFDAGKTPKLYQTEPAGTYHEWKVSAHKWVVFIHVHELLLLLSPG